jgi:hypothetical protein
MIATAVVSEVERLLDEGRLSQRKIDSQTGVSRGTVNAIALGKRTLQEPRRLELDEDFFAPDAPIARCPTCGAKVRMPCLACLIRADQQRRRLATTPRRYTPVQSSRQSATPW